MSPLSQPPQPLVLSFFLEAWPFYALGVAHPRASGFLVGYGQQRQALLSEPMSQEEALAAVQQNFELFKNSLGSKSYGLSEELLVVLFSLKSYFQENFVETKIWSLILLEEVSSKALKPLLLQPSCATDRRLYSPLWASVRRKELTLVQAL